MRVQLPVQINSRDGTLTRDEKVSNMMLYQGGTSRIVKRPGTVRSGLYAPGANPYGAFNFNGSTYVFNGGSTPYIFPGTVVATINFLGGTFYTDINEQYAIFWGETGSSFAVGFIYDDVYLNELWIERQSPIVVTPFDLGASPDGLYAVVYNPGNVSVYRYTAPGSGTLVGTIATGASTPKHAQYTVQTSYATVGDKFEVSVTRPVVVEATIPI